MRVVIGEKELGDAQAHQLKLAVENRVDVLKKVRRKVESEGQFRSVQEIDEQLFILRGGDGEAGLAHYLDDQMDAFERRGQQTLDDEAQAAGIQSIEEALEGVEEAGTRRLLARVTAAVAAIVTALPMDEDVPDEVTVEVDGQDYRCTLDVDDEMEPKLTVWLQNPDDQDEEIGHDISPAAVHAALQDAEDNEAEAGSEDDGGEGDTPESDDSGAGDPTAEATPTPFDEDDDEPPWEKDDEPEVEQAETCVYPGCVLAAEHSGSHEIIGDDEEEEDEDTEEAAEAPAEAETATEMPAADSTDNEDEEAAVPEVFLSDTDLNTTVLSMLKRKGIETVAQLAKRRAAAPDWKGFGPKTLEEIDRVLQEQHEAEPMPV